MTEFLPRSGFFELKWFETSSNGQLLNYQIRSNSYFWWIRERRGVLIKFGTFFKGKNIGILAHLNKFKFYLLEESTVSLGRLFYTSPTINRDKSGIGLILRKHPTSFATDFDLLFLVDLIHVFRILKPLCNAINIRIEDEPRVRFWVILCCYCNHRLILIIQKITSFFQWCLSDLLFLSLISYEWKFFVDVHSICSECHLTDWLL